MITSKQRAYLRSIAQNLEPIFQVGKNGVNDNQVAQLIDALEAREIIKITLLDSTPADKHTIADEIAKRTDSDVVQLIGKKLTIYRKSTKNPKIVLPK
ncbi:MAG: ribosome assembly RNA-binding protein YhbY [Clostridia bacterium]|nr:ribosome assembly RNA-binding protein YhbY [Clostridia bacterium]